MTVMQRGRNWSFVIWVPDDPGRRQVWRGGYRTKSEASAAERRFLVELEDEGARERTRGVGPTVGEFLGNWLVVSEPTRRPTTSMSHERCVLDHVVPYLGDVQLGELIGAVGDRVMVRFLRSALTPQKISDLVPVVRPDGVVTVSAARVWSFVHS